MEIPSGLLDIMSGDFGVGVVVCVITPTEHNSSVELTFYPPTVRYNPRLYRFDRESLLVESLCILVSQFARSFNLFHL